MIITKAKRSHLWAGPEKFIDFTSGGIFAAVLGANNSELRKAANEADLTCCYSHRFENRQTERYKAMLREFTGYESVVLFTTGSEATEAFWRACRVYTGKPGVWGGLVDPDQVGQPIPNPLYDAMHGWTLGALIMAGRMRLPNPGMYEALTDGLFGREHDLTGCGIFEPYHAPSAQFHADKTQDKLRSLIETFPGIPFCCDEVQGGFGRTGMLFAHQWYNDLKPAFVTIGKACGAGWPLSALLGPKEILEDRLVVENAHLHSTHSGHPVMANVGCRVIEIIQRDDLIDQALHLGADLERELEDCGVRFHAGRGLLAGLEFMDAAEASAVVRACERRGLLVVETGRKWVKLGPPYIITERELVKGVKILKKAIEEVLDERADTEAHGDSGQEPGEGDGVVQGTWVSAGEVQPGELAEGAGGGEDEDSGGTSLH